MDIKFREITVEEIEIIKPLWEKLNRHHVSKSIDFKDDFRELRFEERVKRLKNKVIKITGAYDLETTELIGYSFSSIDDTRSGEIESIYIEPEYRDQGIGREFMLSSIQWFEGNQVREIVLSVAVGNEQVLHFYRDFGFRSRTYRLKRV